MASVAVILDNSNFYNGKDYSMQSLTSNRKNPSKETCQQIIRRILSTEILEHGSNRHFKQAADFMSYFQSLYPASDSLTKQVQRAIKDMDMPKDELGYFVPNKTAEQIVSEKKLTALLQESGSQLNTLENCEPLFLSLNPNFCDYFIHLIQECETFQGKYVTIVKAQNGLIFYTPVKEQLRILLESLL